MKRILLAALLIIGAHQTSEAQFLKKLKNKAKEYQKTAEQKLEGKIDQQVEKQMDKSLENAFNPQMSMQQSEPIDKTFKFTQLVNYQMSLGDKVANDFTMYSSPKFKDMLIKVSAQGQDMKMLIDAEKNIYSFMEYDGKKVQMGLPGNQMNAMFKTEGIDEEAELIETGKEKEILGYTCKEYIVKNENEDIQLWITDEVTLNSPFIENSQITGMLLEMTTKTEEGDFEMKVTKVKENINYTFKSGQYKSMSQMSL